MVGPLLNSIEQQVSKVMADKAYDNDKVYEDINSILSEEVDIVIPGRPNASKVCYFKVNPDNRELAHKKWFDLGEQQWQKETGYNKRCLVENAMMRYKKLIGDKLFSRKFSNQKVESLIGSMILNRMLDLGKPVTIAA